MGPRGHDRKDMKDRWRDTKGMSRPATFQRCSCLSLHLSQDVWACKMVWLKLGGNYRNRHTPLNVAVLSAGWANSIKDIMSFQANGIKYHSRQKDGEGVTQTCKKKWAKCHAEKRLQIMHILLWHSMLSDDGHQSCPVPLVKVTVSLSGLWAYEALITGLHG